MIKKTVLSCMIFFSTSSVLFAKTTPYIGGGLALGGFNQASGLRGASGGVFAGTGKLLGENDKFYLGGELSANVYPHTNNNVSYGVGASIIPGVMITKDTMLYGRVGEAFSYFPSSTVSTSHSQNIMQFGPMVGVGVQTNIAKQWAVRTEYISYTSTNSNQAGVSFIYKLE